MATLRETIGGIVYVGERDVADSRKAAGDENARIWERDATAAEARGTLGAA